MDYFTSFQIVVRFKAFIISPSARHVLSNGGGEGSYLLQLIEELCTQSDKLMEDARKEKEDLQQQVS